MTKPTLQYYLDRYTLGTITQEEWEIFRILLKEERNLEILDHYMDEQLQEAAALGWQYPEINKEITARVLAEINAEQVIQSPGAAHRIHFLKTAWFRYAAAIIIIFGIGAYLWINNHNGKELATTTGTRPLQTDIPPGGEKAVLTLADGSKILLDSAANGQLANQGGVKVVKLANGQVTYDLRGLSSREVMWNTMSTPKGGQYRVVLPDGTKVWLNASSSITFPTAFTGSDRAVKIVGEIYFEVAKNKQQPFVIDVNGKSSVEVLGTSFNINSYVDEENIKTTLLEGSVKVGAKGQSAILKPGQQAVSGSFNRPPQSGALVSVISNADTEQALAWKNGLFNFNGADLPAVARQLERWYDIQVKYDGAIPDLKFKGEMNRGVKLSTVLSWFSGLGINTRLEGTTLIIL